MANVLGGYALGERGGGGGSGGARLWQHVRNAPASASARGVEFLSWCWGQRGEPLCLRGAAI